MEFEARGINISEDHGVVIVGLSDDEQTPSQYVLLQRTLNPGDQDRKLGHDRLHLQVNSDSKSGYVDIEKAVLSQNQLSLRFTDDTAKRLGIDGTIDIRLPSDHEQLSAIKSACRKLIDEKYLELG